MNVLRAIITSAVGNAIAEHPKYFTPRGQEKAQAAIVRRIMAALRDDDGTEEPTPAATAIEPPFMMCDADSREAQGYINLRKIAGAVEAKRSGDGKVIVRREAFCEAVFALADIPPREQWLFITDATQIRAWLDFFRETLPDIGRRSLFEPRGAQSGIVMPYPFPPSKAGKVYDPNELSETEAAE
jgi:hypothetical protein